jgi:hypothetical protein
MGWNRVTASVVAALLFGGTVTVPPAVDVTHAEPSSYLSLSPARVLDTRPGYTTDDGVSAGGGMFGAGSETPLLVAGRAGVPANAKAVVLNLAVTGSTRPGFVTVFPCGQARPNAANLNYAAGDTVSNAVTAQIGANGSICIFVLSATHVIVDVTGAYPSTSGFQGLVPARLLDSRPGFATVDGQAAGGGIHAARSTTPLLVRARGGSGDATAVVLNVAVTGSTVPGFVTVFPCGEAQPNAASLNYAAGQTISNAVTAKVGTNGQVCIFVYSATHVIVDVTGAFPTGAGFTPLVPARLLDTRGGFSTVDGRQNGIGRRTVDSETAVVVATRGGVGSVDAVVLNVAVTGSTAPGFVTIYPCGTTRPNASSLNFAAGQTISNAVTAKVGTNGKICVYVFAATDVIIDVTGYFPGSVTFDPNAEVKQRFHAVYLRASDSPDNSAAAIPQIRTDIARALAWFDTQTTPVRHPDFVMSGGQISVLSFTSTMTKAEIRSGDSYLRATNEIVGDPGFRIGDMMVVWYEGDIELRFCGLTGFGVVFIPYDNCKGLDRTTPGNWPFGFSQLIGHELTHALGAVPACAPNSSGDGHVLQGPRDILYAGTETWDYQNLELDPGHDDYYHSNIPGCPNIDNSELWSW